MFGNTSTNCLDILGPYLVHIIYLPIHLYLHPSIYPSTQCSVHLFVQKRKGQSQSAVPRDRTQRWQRPLVVMTTTDIVFWPIATILVHGNLHDECRCVLFHTKSINCSNLFSKSIAFWSAHLKKKMYLCHLCAAYWTSKAQYFNYQTRYIYINKLYQFFNQFEKKILFSANRNRYFYLQKVWESVIHSAHRNTYFCWQNVWLSNPYTKKAS